ncbi:hypothetical protein CONCODRAFT_9350 [Conidiobolus coronatus NRRL 28638]|uniref:F-box domain-containing protein n=1 Tax=Conidiobolus coronatus (strain ATCC 28846 / CBS 209.66 / NRRL 28638) TaxID=796925 RepID=A0A137P016_CONC2|nr:hypothetical protein CONCODRAFT_9350 [Conidiobolus coronatus NRRL 28638]|eukprot:KXN68420.1 hypothetical protein CONCODRAFT_9350 [Conidiobolus coronatus NRRL 28638]
MKNNKLKFDSKTIANSALVSPHNVIDALKSSHILKNIFKQSEGASLKNLSLVSKKWNKLAKPYLKSKITLYRNNVWVTNPNGRANQPNIREEAELCIEENRKYSDLIKDFKLWADLPLNLTLDFFTTFTNLTKLEIFNLRLYQVNILTALRPLESLEELIFTKVNITHYVPFRQVQREDPKLVNLPSSLKILKFKYLHTDGDPKIFIQLINTHSKLKEFEADSIISSYGIINGILKPYPTLEKFSYQTSNENISDKLLSFIESNPQLKVFYLSCNSLNGYFLSKILQDLDSLTHLNLVKGCLDSKSKPLIQTMFNSPTALKYLNLNWDSLPSNVIDSILLNSPKLENLSLHLPEDFDHWINIIKLRCSRLKKLKYEFSTNLNLSNYEILENSKNLIEVAFNSDIKYKSESTLIELHFVNLHPIAINLDYFQLFSNLLFIKISLVKYLYKNNINKIEEYFKQIEEFDIEVIDGEYFVEVNLTKKINYC